MPSRRSRSRSRSPRDRSRSPERIRELQNGAKPISESDYFQKSDEFRLWLKEDKGKYFDELSGDRARSYFRKFVKVWNRGKLSRNYYEGIDSSKIPANNQTAYKWSFTSKSNKAESEALRNTREEVGAATWGRERDYTQPAAGTSSRTTGRVLGPTLPSSSDITLTRELEAEQREEERSYKRKRDKKEAKERVEDMMGPREVGREAMLEKKRLRRDNDRVFREKGDEGLEVDETTLMGGNDSFHAQIARRDAAKTRYEKKNEEKTMAIRERASALKEKEKATMDMFQQLAKQRFG
ncbi:hypothetical protein BDQ17DRAFT_1233417 [Cyathus striatus]|nr:hypothetical protein BDQ17DRAFT_1233417 [Cyathus striatus]